MKQRAIIYIFHKNLTLEFKKIFHLFKNLITAEIRIKKLRFQGYASLNSVDPTQIRIRSDVTSGLPDKPGR